MTDRTLEVLATRTRDMTGQRAIARLGTKYRDAVLTNPHCDATLFAELYQTTGKSKLSITAAKRAVEDGLCEVKLRHVTSTETRAGVLAAAYQNIIPTIEEITSRPLLAAMSHAGPAKLVVDHWGPQLDLVALAVLPAETLHESLRVWRLLAPTLSDEEVLAELRTFDEWATFNKQVTMSWIFHTRPHLIRDLIDASSISVKLQATGTVVLGLLDEQEQETFLDLTGLSGQATHPQNWYEARNYLWMAAAGNPTLHLGLLDKLKSGLAHAANEYSATDLVSNRRAYNNWTVDTFSKTMEPATMARLIRWTSPSDQAKGRPSAFIELLANPSLSGDDAERMTSSFVSLQWLPRLTWLMPEVREAFVSAEDRFPTIRGQLVSSWDDLNEKTGPSIVRSADGRWCGPVREPIQPPDAQPTDHSATRVRDLVYSSAARWLESQLNGNVDLWDMALKLIPTMSEDTLGELVTLCTAVLI